MNRLLFRVIAAWMLVIVPWSSWAQSGSSTIHAPGQNATTVRVSPAGDGSYKIEVPGQSATIIKVSPSKGGGGNVTAPPPSTVNATGGSDTTQTPGQMPTPARQNVGGAYKIQRPGQTPTVIGPARAMGT